jgi:S1-C subfamily serine protease
VRPSDDWTFRPTVVVRRGTSQGSGTIIASVDGQTLVLTASHVLKGDGPIVVELHRYNVGMERYPAAAGAWPRKVGASLAAADRAADVAILRIEQVVALPYVARLASQEQEPAADSVVTSVGIDLGVKLMSWTSLLVDTLWFELNDSQHERAFFITAKAPEHGRSGGGLFLSTGELVGVCVGHAELVPGQRMGIFASRDSIQQLLASRDLAALVSRSELRRARASGGRSPVRGTDAASRAPATSTVTPTQNVTGRRQEGRAVGSTAGP